MTTATRNEAAELILDTLDKAFSEPVISPVTWAVAVRPAIAAGIAGLQEMERRATVERISRRIDNEVVLEAVSTERVTGHLEVLGAIQAILDAEASR
jgi:predicted transcriptional regulator